MMTENELWIDLNRDMFRKHVFYKKVDDPIFTWNKWKVGWEKEAKNLWKETILLLCSSDKRYDVDGVVISDTNLNQKTRFWLADTFEDAGFSVEYKLFPVTYEEAVKRDRGRMESVGAIVIGNQLAKYNEQFIQGKYIPFTTKPKAAIVDVDGTLAHHFDRSPFDWDRVHEDTADQEVLNVIRGLKLLEYNIIVVSGRDGICANATLEWVTQHLGFAPTAFYIRATGDMRDDRIVKKEIFDDHIRDHYYVTMVFDDRPKVVRMWQELGLKTFILGNPWVEF